MTLQDEVANWCAETFVGQTIEGKLAHLWEELHEAWEQARYYTHKGSRLCDELTDCALLVVEIASMHNLALAKPEHVSDAVYIDFLCEIRLRFEVVSKRKWQPPDAAGIFHHEKE